MPHPATYPLRVERILVRSELLRDNPQGDPADRELLVLLPPGYDHGTRRYPALFLLAGFTGFGATLMARACFEEAIDQRLARLFAEGCPPAIVVLPDCCTRLGGSQYVDSTALGRYASHLIDELVPLVDQRFRTLGRSSGRAVAGKSSGGFGALHLAFERPGTFGAVACHSGDLGFDLCYTRDFPACANAVRRAGGVTPFLTQFFTRRKRSTEDFAAISILAMAAAYSPTPEQSEGLALPFDRDTCEIDAAVFARWLAFDPVRRIERESAALRGLAALWIDCGERDEYHLHFGARRFARACQAHGVALHHEEFDDGHRGTSWRYDHSLPYLLRALAKASG
ncbi:MAG: esterase [Planctomycetes bacterium]|nr:esterase [Planctomycetota bacterium]